MYIHTTLDRELEILGRKHPVKVTIHCYEDDSDDALDMDFESEEEKQKLIKQLERGDISYMGIIVQASLVGEIGEDSLWGCYISNPGDIDTIVNEHGMVDSALAELRLALKLKYDTLKGIFE